MQLNDLPYSVKYQPLMLNRVDACKYAKHLLDSHGVGEPIRTQFETSVMAAWRIFGFVHAADIRKSLQLRMEEAVSGKRK